MDRFLSNHMDIYAYCLMANHFHLLIRIRETQKENTHLPFSHLFNSYTQAINRAQHRTGPLFERPFKRKQILQEDYLYKLVGYIHLNPDHHQSGDYQTFPWSSFQSFLSSSPSLIQRNEVLEWFGSKESFIKAHEGFKLHSDIQQYVLE